MIKPLRSASLKIGRIPYSKFDVGRSMFITATFYTFGLQSAGIAMLLDHFVILSRLWRDSIFKVFGTITKFKDTP